MPTTAMPKGAAGARATNSSPRDTARYLAQIRPLLLTAMRDRQEWLRQVGTLIERARAGNPAAVAEQAGRIGREYIVQFRVSQRDLDGFAVPPACAACHASILRWLDALCASCEVMIEVGITGQVDRIKQTQQVLAEGRFHARQFNLAQAELIAELRAKVRRAA